MVENPDSWNVVTRTINEAIENHAYLTSQGVAGASLPRFIELHLREKGLIAEYTPKAPGTGIADPLGRPKT